MNWHKYVKVAAFAFLVGTVTLFGIVYAAPDQTNSSVEAAPVVTPNTAGTQAPVPAVQNRAQTQPHHQSAVQTASPVAPAPKTAAAPAQPTAVIIPKISLNATVIPVGLTPGHAVDVPNTLKLSGWYTGSPVPGAVGSALIDGHVGNSIGQPGVFANLHKLSVGDSIYVKDKNGNTEHFIVKDMQIYALADVPMGYILENTSEHRLNIITCAGKWVESEDTFDHRLVVYTELAS